MQVEISQYGELVALNAKAPSYTSPEYSYGIYGVQYVIPSTTTVTLHYTLHI